MIIRKAGTHPTLGTVLVSNDVTANLVSLQAARSHFHVHFDDVNNKFELTGKVHGVQYVFTCTDGIFVTNTTAANPLQQQLMCMLLQLLPLQLQLLLLVTHQLLLVILPLLVLHLLQHLILYCLLVMCQPQLLVTAIQLLPLL
jgi:hypothetical protein